MSAVQIYALLQDACKLLDRADDHAVAAHVSYAMSLVSEKYGVGDDHMPIVEDEPCIKVTNS